MGRKVKIYRDKPPVGKKIKIERPPNVVKIERKRKDFLEVGNVIFKRGHLYYINTEENEYGHAYTLDDIYWDDKAQAWFLSLGKGEQEFNANYAVGILEEECFPMDYTKCRCTFECEGYRLIESPGV